jgi:hypothetical protein
MPLPPIPGADWLRFRADSWRKQQQAQLDQLREQASVWDLQAQSAVHGIGDTFSGLGTAVQEALPDLPPPPPMPTPQLELPPPVQDFGASIGGAFSDLGTGIQSGVQGAREAIQSVAPPAPDWSQQAQAAVDSISGAAGGGLDALTDPATYGRAAGIAPLPPGLEGIRPGLQAATQNAAQAVDTLATNPEAVAAAARTVNRLTPTGMIGSLAGQIQEGTTPRQLGREVVQGLPALGALGTLAPTPGAIAGNVLGSVAEQGALGLGLPEGVAGGAGFLADVLTPDPGTAARVAARAPGVLEGLGDLAQSAPRFGVDTLTGGLDTAGAALDDAVLGIRRGQRGLRAPRLSPEQAAQRAADGAAEQRVFDAIQTLWRQGPEGEALADDLRFLAVGKGEEGEAAARSLLARKGLGELLPPGVIPDATAGAEGLLGAATRATDPFLARGALTGGERAFDIGAGTAGGVLGAATADEDATWQERAGRGVLGASLGALGGANARQLGRLAGRGLDGDVLGAAAGRAPAAEGGTLGRAGRVASDVSQAMGSLPLLSVPGLATNFSGGAVRTIERVLGEAFEGRPIDALVDLGGVFKELPGALRRAPESVRRGPTADAPGAGTGPSVDPADLFSREGKVPFLATAGTRLNAATDQFWRDVNEAGALRVAERRGLSGADATEHVAEAGDFATFGGPNSPVARGLTSARAKLSDPNASPAEKATGFAVQAFAPYVMMPERLLRATWETVFPGAHVPALIQAYRRGDQDAIRAVNGRMRLSGVTGFALWKAAEQGAITGPAPEDQKERLRREALGAQWETINIPGLGPQPLRYFGAFGQSASAIASLQDQIASGQAKGDDFPKHLATAAGEAMRWTLDESYVRDFGKFLRDVQQRRGPQSIAGTVGSAPGRLVAPLAGLATAADPYERETTETPLGGVVGTVASRSGLRMALPARIDPTTGEAQRRSGNVVTRYLGERGAEETAENAELARHGLSPRTIQDGKFAGEAQTVDAVRKLRQAYGAETGKAIRETQKTPAYQKASDPEKKLLLEKALRDADFEAELRIGDGVKRSAKAQAAWEYSATAKYSGAPKGADANETRRYNRSVSQARAARTEARKRDPKNPGKAEAEWARANPEAAKLARRTAVSATTLRKKKAEIYSKNGVKP